MKFKCVTCGSNHLTISLMENIVQTTRLRKTLPVAGRFTWALRHKTATLTAWCSGCGATWTGNSLAGLQKSLIEAGVLT